MLPVEVVSCGVFIWLFLKASDDRIKIDCLIPQEDFNAIFCVWLHLLWNVDVVFLIIYGPRNLEDLEIISLSSICFFQSSSEKTVFHRIALLCCSGQWHNEKVHIHP